MKRSIPNSGPAARLLLFALFSGMTALPVHAGGNTDLKVKDLYFPPTGLAPQSPGSSSVTPAPP
jgi:hypothetical protein